MQSRTDQVHSYQFFLQRVVSGLVARESDPAELPFRRLGWAGIGSVMVAVLVAAGFGVYGVLAGGGATGWRDGESIVVEKGSETPYLYRDGRLHPMVNFVSAQLALGGDADVARVSARSLEGVPRGPTLGIPGAPEGLPDGGNLLTGQWAFCSEQRADGRGGTETVSVLGIGRGREAGRPVGAQALLVRDAGRPGGSDLHLVWRGHRFALGSEPEATLRALGASRSRARPVAAVWLDALPVGDPLRPRGEVPVRGAPTTALPDPGEGETVLTGQVIVDAGTYLLVTPAELVELTPLQAEIVLRDPATDDAYPDGPVEAVRMPVPVDADTEPLPERTEASPPESRPELVPEDLLGPVVCAAFTPARFTPDVRVGGQLRTTAGAVVTPGQTAQGSLLADYVLVAGGTAALVQSVASPDAAGGPWHIVTDQGIRYPLPAPEVAGAFGYQPDRRVRVPAGLVDLLPAGPALDPAGAVTPLDPAGP